MAARAAGIGARRIGALAPVGDALDLCKQPELGEVLTVYPSDLEYIEGADGGAVGFALALRPIDDGCERFWFAAAGVGASPGHVRRMLGRPGAVPPSFPCG